MTTDPNTYSKAEIGRRLQLTREALGLNQTVFAERAGLGRNAYTQYENAGKRPSIENAILLCNTYNLTLDWIYRGDLSGLPYQTAAAVKAIQAARTE